jgi:hypothetical protein
MSVGGPDDASIGDAGGGSAVGAGGAVLGSGDNVNSGIDGGAFPGLLAAAAGEKLGAGVETGGAGGAENAGADGGESVDCGDAEGRAGATRGPIGEGVRKAGCSGGAAAVDRGAVDRAAVDHAAVDHPCDRASGGRNAEGRAAVLIAGAVSRRGGGGSSAVAA